MVLIDFLVLAMAIAIVVLVVQNRRTARQPADPAPGDPDTARLAAEMHQLRERIQVLERVITDNHGSSDLGREIDALRDR